MNDNSVIQVSCPKCGTQINQTIEWFKKPGNYCPGCSLRCATERFKKAVELAMQKA